MYGEYLKAVRERNRISVADLAARAGISADAIYKFERNANQPELRTLDRVAGAMGMLVGDLLPNSGGASGNRFEAIEAPLSGLDEEEQTEQILILANQARLVRNAVMRRRPANVVQFPPRDQREMTDDAMERIAQVMRDAGAEPRKATRGPEREVRFYGLASAGDGIEFFDDIPEEYRQIPQRAWKNGARGVFKAAGESMMDVGIFPDDILFIKPTPRPGNGRIAILTVNKKVFVKKLRLDEFGRPTQLLSKNPAYKPIDIAADDEVEFFGEVVGRTGDL